MRASIISAIVTLASFVVAIPTIRPTVLRRDAADSFLMKPAGDSSEDVVGLGHVQWDGTVGGDVGWFPSNSKAKDAKIFIRYNAREGIAFYSRDTAVQVYLKPTSGTCQYAVKIGNPNFETKADPSIRLLTDSFTLDDSDDGTENFGYLHNWNQTWTACGGDGAWTLCYGEINETSDTTVKCKEPFSLVTEHQP